MDEKKDVAPEMTDVMKAKLAAITPADVTPETENERVLVEHQGAVQEMRITDRTTDGKLIKIGNVWRATDSVKIIHRFADSSK